MNDAIAFEAAVHRLLLLVGLTRETDVHDWALARLAEPDAPHELVDVVSAPAMLSPLREALYPLAKIADSAAVAKTVLKELADDPTRHSRSVDDRLRMLRLLREEGSLPLTLRESIKAREEWHMLATHGLPHPEKVTHESLDSWLSSIFSARTA